MKLRPVFHGPHPELVEGRVWDPAPVLGIGGGYQPTSFDKLRIRVVDGGNIPILPNQEVTRMSPCSLSNDGAPQDEAVGG
jgi:hypothetical protein